MSSFANQTIAQIELFTRDDYVSGQIYVLPKHLDEKVTPAPQRSVPFCLVERQTSCHIGVDKAGLTGQRLPLLMRLTYFLSSTGSPPPALPGPAPDRVRRAVARGK
jgi:hypothetical protein